MSNRLQKSGLTQHQTHYGNIVPEFVGNLIHNLPGIAYRCLNDADWTMLYISEGCHGVTGYNANELLFNKSLSFNNLISKDDQDYVRLCVDDAVRSRRQYQIEYRIVDRQGQLRWVWEQGHAIYDANNEVQYLDGYIVEITSRKKIEEELKQVARNLVELNVTKDKFLSLIAHDLQNPVYAIITLSEFISDNLSSFNSSEMSSFLSQINVSAKGIYVLLENLLDWAKSQTGKIVVQKERISLMRLINFLLNHFQPSIADKNITVDFECLEDISLDSDNRLLTSIIRNLLSNAIKYSHPHSKIRISLDREGSKASVCIQDEGIGISRRNLDKIFRIDNDIRRMGTLDEPGSGLGLILVKDFTDKLGGEITFSSKLNQGSTFTLFLPESGANPNLSASS